MFVPPLVHSYWADQYERFIPIENLWSCIQGVRGHGGEGDTFEIYLWEQVFRTKKGGRKHWLKKNTAADPDPNYFASSEAKGIISKKCLKDYFKAWRNWEKKINVGKFSSLSRIRIWIQYIKILRRNPNRTPIGCEFYSPWWVRHAQKHPYPRPVLTAESIKMGGMQYAV